jgi:hypothetical protein
LYRTNRDCTILSDTSVWAIDLLEGRERQLLEPAYHNDIVGFLSDSCVVIGSLAGTRLADVNTGKVVPLNLPALPNFSVSAVNNGILVYRSYTDNSTESTAVVCPVDATTGEWKAISEVVGYLDGKVEFSASGRDVAIRYGHDSMVGAVDVMLVDSVSGQKTSLNSSLPTEQRLTGVMSRFQWLGAESFIISMQNESEEQTYLITCTAE